MNTVQIWSNIKHEPGHRDYYAKYGIDWDRNEEKFKDPIAGVLRYYQGGRREILITGEGKPGLRKVMRGHGVDFRLLGELDMDMYTPEGVKITRSRIQGTGTFLVDCEFNRVIRGNCTVYDDGGHAPVANRRIMVLVDQPELANRWFDDNKEALELCVTINALTNTLMPSDEGIAREVRFWVNEMDRLTVSNYATEMGILGYMYAKRPRKLKGLVAAVFRKSVQVPYLTIGEQK